MKKYLFVILAAILAFALILTSCSGGSFSCSSIDDKSAVFEADTAGTDMEVTTGTLVVGDGESVTFDATALTEGALHFGLYSNEGMDDPEETPDLSELDPALTAEPAAGETITFSVAPGEYLINASVTDKATGTVTVTVAADPNAEASEENWISAESTDEAGEKAGVGLFLCDPQGTSLGAVTNADYHYMEGIAEAHYGLAAVSVTVHKGLKTINDGDVSMDSNDYANEWTWNVNGTEVKCFGNREGEATKSIWTTDDYAYSITAYGEGGDTDYGLSEEDFTTIFNDLQ